MKPIATLTVNPAIDYASEAEEVVPVRKIRTRGERFDPGGGGINVARVIRELGGEAQAVYMAGGVSGPVFEGLLARTGVSGRRVPIAGDTRISHLVREHSTGHEFRFTPAGPTVSAEEWSRCRAAIEAVEAEFLVLSGSLAPGLPNDAYARIITDVKPRGVRVVLDTSGAPLHWALEAGVHLVTPNRRELEHLLGRRACGEREEEAMAAELVASGRAEMVALTLGPRGALLVTADTVLRLPAPEVATVSTVGAGDGFTAAMTLGLARGWDAARAFAYGIAAGAATATTPGTELCHRGDVERLFETLLARLP